MRGKMLRAECACASRPVRLCACAGRVSTAVWKDGLLSVLELRSVPLMMYRPKLARLERDGARAHRSHTRASMQSAVRSTRLPRLQRYQRRRRRRTCQSVAAAAAAAV